MYLYDIKLFILNTGSLASGKKEVRFIVNLLLITGISKCMGSIQIDHPLPDIVIFYIYWVDLCNVSHAILYTKLARRFLLITARLCQVSAALNVFTFRKMDNLNVCINLKCYITVMIYIILFKNYFMHIVKLRLYWWCNFKDRVSSLSYWSGHRCIWVFGV